MVTSSCLFSQHLIVEGDLKVDGKISLEDTTGNTGANVIVGISAGFGITTGSYNTLFGYYSGANLNSSNNTLLGAEAGRYNLGAGNTFVGTLSGKGSSGNGSDNTALGHRSGWLLTNGYSNTFIGTDAGKSTMTGYQNTAVGFQALLNNISGWNNTVLGLNAGKSIKQGNNNTVLGIEADVSDTAAVNQIVMGYGATGKGDNTAVFGDSTLTDVYLAEDGNAKAHLGSAKISSLDDTYNSDSIVVWLPDSTLGIRSLTEFIPQGNTQGEMLFGMATIG